MKPLKYEWRNLYYLLMVSFPLVLADQLTKLWALTLKGSEPVVLSESWWRFIYVENRGALWGIGNDFPVFYRKLIFLGISSVITLFIVYLLVTYSENRLMKVIYGFVLGGAIGNLIDRFFRGFVVDFIDWHAGDIYHWPTFNIADAAIVVAVFLLAIEVFFNHKRQSAGVKK